MINNANVMGRVINEPKLRRGSNFGHYLPFALLVESPNKDENGDRYVFTVSCCAFGDVASYLANNMKKGTVLAVTGPLSRTHYYNKENKLITDMYVHVESYIILKPTLTKDKRVFIKFDYVTYENKKKGDFVYDGDEK